MEIITRNDNFQAFHLFDVSGDGEIENQYLEDALRVLGHNPKDDEIAAFRAKQFASFGTIRKLSTKPPAQHIMSLCTE